MYLFCNALCKSSVVNYLSAERLRFEATGKKIPEKRQRLVGGIILYCIRLYNNYTIPVYSNNIVFYIALFISVIFFYTTVLYVLYVL